MSKNGPKTRWQELYEATSSETNHEKLIDLMQRIEEALAQREQGLRQGSGSTEELAAMAQAAQNLLTIKSKKLGWPEIKLDGK